ncbi:MAG: hypothetical protein JXP34_08335 [Planctomycetes bacterium]|nr:hypothetical protein [Planctomycetota bacterium]
MGFRHFGLLAVWLGVTAVPGRGQGFLRLVDARGQVWDLHTAGQVIDGTNDTFDGGLLFDVNGQGIAEIVERNPSLSRVEKDEMIIGPMEMGGGISVTRRIGLAADRQSLRLMTIIENRSDRRTELTIGHYTCVGSMLQSVRFSSGGITPGERDHAVAFIQDPPRNSVIEVFGQRGVKQRIRVQVPTRGGGEGDDAPIDYGPITVPARRPIMVVTFAIQAACGSEDRVMREFDVKAAIEDLPWKLRRMIINLGRRAEIPALDIDREIGHDLLCLASGTILRGEVRAEGYAVRGPHGTVEIPAAEVIGIARPERGDVVRVGCRDGQIFVGQLDPDPLVFALQGDVLRVPVAKIRSLGIRDVPPPAEAEAGDEKGDDEAGENEGEGEAPALPPGSWIALDGGDLWRFEGFAERPVAVTLYGDVEIDPERVVRIVFRGDQGPFHTLHLRGGSRIAGIVRPGPLRAKLSGGRTVTVPVGGIAWAGLPDDPEGDVVGPGVFIADLGGEERIVGRLLSERLILETELGEMAVATERIRKLEVDREGIPPNVEILLWDGSRLKGTLAAETVAMDADGFRLAVDLSRVETMGQPRPGIPDDARARLEGLVERLDAPEFDVREEAQRALDSWIRDPAAGLGGALAVELEALLEGTSLSEEQATRIRSILGEGEEGGRRRAPVGSSGEEMGELELDF